MTDLVSGAIHLSSSPLQPVPGDGHNYRKYKNIVKNSSHRSPLCQPYILAPNTTFSALRLNRRSAPLRSIKRSLGYMCKTKSDYSSDRSPLHWGAILSSNLSVSADRRSCSEYMAPKKTITSYKVPRNIRESISAALYTYRCSSCIDLVSSPLQIYRKASLATSTPSCFPLRCFFRFLLAP